MALVLGLAGLWRDLGLEGAEIAVEVAFGINRGNNLAQAAGVGLLDGLDWANAQTVAEQKLLTKRGCRRDG